MPLLSREELKTLVEKPQKHCVSIYLPTHTAGPEIQQDPIRFKNLMRQAEEHLVESGLRQADAVELLKPAQELDRDNFWRHQDHGLAIFIADNFFHYYRLPLDFEELVVVGDRFHLKPLMPLLNNNGRFYILALSQNQLRLLQGTQHQIDEIDLHKLEDIPESLKEALRYDDTENQTQFTTTHSGASAGAPGSDPGTIHGRGVDEDEENQILRFFSQVNRGLQELLHDENVPMVLAGVEYLHPIYQRANSYPHLMEEGISGNPEHMKPEELQKKAWGILEPYFHKAQTEAAERYREFSGNNQEQASQDLKEVVKAAYYHRVDSLFVATGYQQWGKYDPESDTVQLHEEEQNSDEDLLDFAAVHTLLNGGTVFATEPDQVPGNAPVAAIFRY
jgi:hypothetical protein